MLRQQQDTLERSKLKIWFSWQFSIQGQGGNEKHTKESIICKDVYAQEKK